MNKCKWCGSTVKSKRAVFCGKSCYTLFQLSDKNPYRKRKELRCGVCNKSFYVMNYMKERTKFCSRECSAIGQSRPIQKSYKVDKVCKSCGNMYTVHRYRSDESKFCSKNCKHSIGNVITKCLWCGDVFDSQLHKKRNFCSQSCSVKYFGPSNLEKTVESFIKETDAHYVSQQTIKTTGGRFVVDFIINNNTVVDVHGDYWHCNPQYYSSNYYHKQIRKTAEEIWEIDEFRKNELENMGFSYFVIWENHKNKNIFLDKINEVIDEICKG